MSVSEKSSDKEIIVNKAASKKCVKKMRSIIKIKQKTMKKLKSGNNLPAEHARPSEIE